MRIKTSRFAKAKNYNSLQFLLPLLSLLLFSCQAKKKYDNWEHYKGSPEGIHYSSLTQIDTSNVKQLQVAWEYHTGDADTANHSQIQCNPIMVDGMVYGTSPLLKLFAIDAATGKEKWVFNPFDSLNSNNKKLHFILNNNRGVAYWSDAEGADKRIYYTAGSKLYAVNASNGKLVKNFGNNGSIDLHEGLGRDVSNLFITATSPPVIFKDILITGTRVDEGPQAAPGHIRAYDVRTGKQNWIFHTIPHPGEEGYESWDDPEAYKFIGGANAWSGLTLDTKNGIVYAGTGSASYDFYGGKRTGDNLFANTLLALDAVTGKRKWHFQVVHHDVWDRDLSSPPVLINIKRENKNIDAVALTTKSGFVYVFERTTGKPVYEITEKPVPQHTLLTGEKLSATQPYPSKPAAFMRQSFTEKDINPYLPDSSKEDIKKRLAILAHDHMYDPMSTTGIVEFPGLDGGAEWGGPTFDPETGYLYVNANEMPWEIEIVPISNNSPVEETYGMAGERLFQSTCMSCHGADRKGAGNFPSILHVKSKYNFEMLNELLQTGRRMMPAFKQLSEEERKAICSYVLENKTDQQKKFITPTDTGSNPYDLPYTIKGYNKFLSKEGLPAIAPPWGTLNAIDLNTGEFVWKKTLGHDERVKNAKEPTGIENYGASVVTAGGVLFIAATKDSKLRGFNKRTGELLWEVKLPVAAFATPAVYSVNGKQYIIIACGGGKNGLPSGDSYIAYTLPDK